MSTGGRGRGEGESGAQAGGGVARVVGFLGVPGKAGGRGGIQY